MTFSFEWNELQAVLEDVAPSEAQRDKVEQTVAALRKQAARLPHLEMLHQLCAGIWLTMSDEGPQILAQLEELTRTH